MGTTLLVNEPYLYSARMATFKTTFDGTADNGAVGNVSFATLNGVFIMNYMIIKCGASLVSAGGGSIRLTSNAGFVLIPATTATDLTIGKLWVGATSNFTDSDTMPNTMRDLIMNPNTSGSDLRFEISTADVTAGQLLTYFIYLPINVEARIA